MNSIAFYPAIIVLAFLLLSALSIRFDFSEFGEELKSRFSMLRLRDASTARSIISAITAGIITLTVFSFSMVMIVLNQTASQLSNRILDRLIGSRFQQLVLGNYVGTIIYSLFVLSTVRDLDQGVQIPALSIYLLILLTVFDIFLFIYFLHYITQSVKYEVIIKQILEETKSSLEQACPLSQESSESISFEAEAYVHASKSGIYQGFDEKVLSKIATENNAVLEFLQTLGTFVIIGAPIIQVNKNLPEEAVETIKKNVYLRSNESIQENYYFGFNQLTEIALKALSPGINDPGTAITSVRALFHLYAFRVFHFPENTFQNEDLQVRIIANALTFDEIFKNSLYPIWDYGQEDRLLQNELYYLLKSFHAIAPDAKIVLSLLQKVELKVNDPKR